MEKAVYICFKKSTKVQNPSVYLRDVASIYSTDNKLTTKLRAIKIYEFQNERNNRIILTSIKIIQIILSLSEAISINAYGETNCIIEYDYKTPKPRIYEYAKVLLVCFICFFGAGFTIMAFNNDIDVTKLFALIYEKVTHKEHNGFGIMEIMYSLGISVGILIFYNHFGRKKITKDPTPLEIEMRQYENDINTTLTDGVRRKDVHIDVD